MGIRAGARWVSGESTARRTLGYQAGTRHAVKWNGGEDCAGRSHFSVGRTLFEPPYDCATLFAVALKRTANGVGLLQMPYLSSTVTRWILPVNLLAPAL